ncbi:MAG: CHASE2 domain-containing protein [Deltaproteobacteria bacterium]|nr:CHASE2 domain-containing protein [Deltaproteobacteria bacterium]
MIRIALKIEKTDLIIGILSAVLFAALSFGTFRVFETLEKIIYGIEMRLDLPERIGENRIAIVNIDEKSINQLGRWPWPRSFIADMIQILKSNGAKLIALDLLLSEKERNQGLEEIRGLQKAILTRDQAASRDFWLMENLRGIQERLDNDRKLSRTVGECGNVLLPLLGTFGKYETEVVIQEDSFLKKSSFSMKGASEEFLSVNQITTPFDELARTAHGLGHINLSPNALLQGEVHLLFVNYRGHLIPSLPLRLTLDYLNKRIEDAVVPGKGIRVAKSLIPTVKGEIFVKFKGGKRSFPYYSFVDILNVKKVPAVFEDKIVLIGSTAEGATVVPTPVDLEMPRVELAANVIENLIEDRFVKRPNHIIYLETLLLLLVALAGAAILPRFSLLNRLGAMAGMLFLVFVLGLISFAAFDVWLKTVYIGLCLVTVYIAISVKDFIVKARTYELTSKESIETNRMLGLSLQSQGLLDLAFEKFRKCPLDDAMKDVVYNLGLDYERKRMINKAVSVYEYILTGDRDFRDLEDRIPKLRKMISPYPSSGYEGRKEAKIVVSDDLGIKPTVGRYEILGELGQGAMGIVYKARDPKINRLLAIKTIRFSDEFEEEKLKEVKDRFLREAEIAGKLSHPSVVSIYDVGEDYDLTYMAMEFLEGDNLQGFCRMGSLLPLRKVLYVVAETASALHYAHSNGVVHRDIKPANIMFLKDGHIKVTDFGIAKAVSSSQTKSGVVLGTPNYMSPEQINGHEIDGRSDIFSLGVVFYELLTGQPPFKGKTLTNLFYQITQVKHAPVRSVNPKVPKPCEQILDKALAKDPDLRFQSAGELAKYLNAVAVRIEQLRGRQSA